MEGTVFYIKMNLVITNRDSLLYLVQKKPRQVTLDLRELSSVENKRYERELNSQLFNCGCELGKSYILSFFPLVILISIAGLLIGVIPFRSMLLIIFVMVILSGLTGKIISLRNSHKQIKRIISEILLLIKN